MYQPGGATLGSGGLVSTTPSSPRRASSTERCSMSTAWVTAPGRMSTTLSTADGSLTASGRRAAYPTALGAPVTSGRLPPRKR